MSQPRMRKRAAELVRWDDALMDTRREETGYVSEWQQFCGEVPRERFEEGMSLIHISEPTRPY